jgi:hypothetical protein
VESLTGALLMDPFGFFDTEMRTRRPEWFEFQVVAMFMRKPYNRKLRRTSGKATKRSMKYAHHRRSLRPFKGDYGEPENDSMFTPTTPD